MVTEHVICDHDLNKDQNISKKNQFFIIVFHIMNFLAMLQVKPD